MGKTEVTDLVREYTRQAFQAILRGDYAERDRLVELARQALADQEAQQCRVREIRNSDSIARN